MRFSLVCFMSNPITLLGLMNASLPASLDFITRSLDFITTKTVKVVSFFGEFCLRRNRDEIKSAPRREAGKGVHFDWRRKDINYQTRSASSHSAADFPDSAGSEVSAVRPGTQIDYARLGISWNFCLHALNASVPFKGLRTHTGRRLCDFVYGQSGTRLKDAKT